MKRDRGMWDRGIGIGEEMAEELQPGFSYDSPGQDSAEKHLFILFPCPPFPCPSFWIRGDLAQRSQSELGSAGGTPAPCGAWARLRNEANSEERSAAGTPRSR